MAAHLPSLSPHDTQLCQALLSAMVDPAWLCTPAGIVLAANEAAHDAVETDAATAMIGQPIDTVLPVFASPEAKRFLTVAAAGPEPVGFEDVQALSAMEYTIQAVQGLQLLLVQGKDVTPLRKATEHFRQEQQRFNYLLESLDGPVMLVGADLVVRYVNRASRKLLGAMVGSHAPEVPCLQDAVLERLPREPSSWEWSAGGQYFQMASAPMTDADGALAFIIHGIDITRRKKAELRLSHNQHQLDALVRNAQEGIIAVTDGVIVFANPFMRLLTGYPPEALLGKPFFQFLHPEDQPRVLDIYQRRIAGEDVPHTYDFRLQHRSGAVHWVQTASALIEWEGKAAVLAMLSDITAHKVMEEKLRELLQEQDQIISGKTQSLMQTNKQLEQEIAHKTLMEESLRSVNESLWQSMEEQRRTAIKLEKATRKAMESTQAKSLFLANMSHEIRTPMNVILGMAQVALRDAPSGMNLRPLEMIRDSGAQLLTIINDLLDVSKIEAQQMQIERIPFDLHALLKRTTESFRLQAADKGLALHLDIHPQAPAVVSGDATRLGQIFNNLLSNALKFTAQGSVAIWGRPIRPRSKPHARARPQDALPNMLFCVEDTGTGIPQHKLETIFEGFTQADESISRQYGGTGLGLTICRHLARLMGGNVWVHSTEGKGSRFYCSLPLPPLDACLYTAGAEQCAQAGATPSTLRLLLAEDVPQNVEMLVALLSPYGHVLEHAANGEEALEMLRRSMSAGGSPYDAVLMDVQMPVMDGLAATRAIRRGDDPLLPRDIPIIALTAHSLASEKAKIMRAGVTMHVAKPVDLRQLLIALEDIANASHVTLHPWAAETPLHAEQGDADPAFAQPWQSGREAALERLGGSETLLLRLSAIFLRDAGVMLGALAAAWEQEDLSEIAERAHALKGSASAIGALPLMHAAEAVETAARNQDATALAGLVDSLTSEVQRATTGVQQQTGAAASP